MPFFFPPKPSPQSGLNNFSINPFVDFSLYRQFNSQTLFSFSYLLLIKKDSFLNPIPRLSETAFFYFPRLIITMRNKAITCKLHSIPLSLNKYISISHLKRSSDPRDSYKDFLSHAFRQMSYTLKLLYR